MGKGSTQYQHLIETEVPPKRLEEWLKHWAGHYQLDPNLRVTLRPHTAGSELLELTLVDSKETKMANIIFAVLQDRRERNMLSIRDQNTFNEDFRKKRLMTLNTLFLIHRYKAVSVHYVTPTEDNQFQAEGMRGLGLYDEIRTEIGDARGADVDGVQIPVTLEPVERPHVLTRDLEGGQVRALAQHRQIQQRAAGRPVWVGVTQPQRAESGQAAQGFERDRPGVDEVDDLGVGCELPTCEQDRQGLRGNGNTFW